MEQVRSLECGKIDVALLLEASVHADNLITECLTDEKIVFVSALSHVLAPVASD